MELRSFFISTPIGFELQTAEEIHRVWPLLIGKNAQVHQAPLPSLNVFPGGIEFEADMFLGLQLNFFLKTANRILLRMASFKARDLPKFYQKFKALPWVEFLPDGNVEWETTAKTSRINNEKRLRESGAAALAEIFPQKISSELCGSIYIRMEDDLCTISLDTTGEHLHKRGWSTLKGEAPLRETIASSLLLQMIEGVPGNRLGEIALLDPMMGSGTFLCEARGFQQGHFRRTYAFQKWKNAPKLFLSPHFAFNYKMELPPAFRKYIGFDVDPEMLKIARVNFSEVEDQLRFVQKKKFIEQELEIYCDDSLKTEIKLTEPLYLIVNPPYGERLMETEIKNIDELALVFTQRFSPLKLGLLFPDNQKVQKSPKGYIKEKEVKINNGGIRCFFTILSRK